MNVLTIITVTGKYQINKIWMMNMILMVTYASIIC